MGSEDREGIPLSGRALVRPRNPSVVVDNCSGGGTVRCEVPDRLSTVDQTNGLNTRFMTRASNIILGTDLTGDFEEFRLWYSLDNDQIRATMKWAIGMAVVQPDLVVGANLNRAQA